MDIQLLPRLPYNLFCCRKRLFTHNNVRIRNDKPTMAVLPSSLVVFITNPKI